LALSAIKTQLPDSALAVSEPLQVEFMSAPVQQREPFSKAVRAETAHIEQSAKPRATRPIAVGARIRTRSVGLPSSSHEKTPASMPALPSTARGHCLTYTLKNSKRYRYNWGQMVRSMMGTAVEGVRQGLVRFRIEIAPNGELTRVEVLWSTSEIAEKLALQAIRSLPPLPPTPTGKPLVFEKTIAFMPFETGWPPIYKYDCLPDPPSFQNSFAWNGSSPQRTSQDHQENASPSRSAAPQAECPDSGQTPSKRKRTWNANSKNGVRD
jgi:TonB family protein